MTYSIAIGAYKLPQFVELCIKRCRTLFGPDVPILVSDDFSDRSTAIRAIANAHECDYDCPAKRRSHFSGDMQVFINALKFCEELETDAVVKISQRFIPVLPAFKDAMDTAFANGDVQVCLPGQIHRRQIARREAMFYSKFGILTDVLAIRRGAITPKELIDCYRKRCHPGSRPSDSFAETTWGCLLAERFGGRRHRILPEWTNHQPNQPKVYLRKSQAKETDYGQIGAMEGMAGHWDLREWRLIEMRGYKPKPDVV